MPDIAPPGALGAAEPEPPDVTARAVLDAALYATLATADAAGTPWATPVFVAVAPGGGAVYWMSAPTTTHSQNIAVRPEVALTAFDSAQPPGTGRGVYLAATAAVVPDDELAAALAVYPGPPSRGGRPIAVDEVSPPGHYRLYRATVTGAWVVCPDAGRVPCPTHGVRGDHRIEVHLDG